MPWLMQYYVPSRCRFPSHPSPPPTTCVRQMIRRFHSQRLYLWLWTRDHIRPSVCLCVWLYVSTSVCLSICASVYVYLSVCRSVSVFFRFLRMSVCLSVRLSMYIQLSVCMSVYLFVLSFFPPIILPSIRPTILCLLSKESLPISIRPSLFPTHTLPTPVTPTLFNPSDHNSCLSPSIPSSLPCARHPR